MSLEPLPFWCFRVDGAMLRQVSCGRRHTTPSPQKPTLAHEDWPELGACLAERRSAPYSGRLPDDNLVWRTCMRSLFKLIRLSPGRRRLLFQAALLVVASRVGVRLLSLPKLTGLLRRSSRKSHRSAVVEDITWAIDIAGRYLPRTKCLPRALALQALLSRYGRESSLQIGVAKDGEEALEAHAWVVLDGEVLFGGPDVARYTPMMTETVKGSGA